MTTQLTVKRNGFSYNQDVHISDGKRAVMTSHNLVAIFRYNRISPVKSITINHKRGCNGYRYFVTFADGNYCDTTFQSDVVAVNWTIYRRAFGRNYQMTRNNDVTTFIYK